MDRNIVDIVKSLVLQLNSEIIATSIVGNTNGTYSIFTCDPKYSTTVLSINGVSILEVIPRGSYYEIIVESEVVRPLSISPAKYYHGTLIATNKLINTNSTDPDEVPVFPMIYFPETRNPVRRYARTDLREMSADIRLIFAVPFGQDWNSEQIKDNCINPMIVLARRFRDVVQNATNIELVGNYTEEQYSKLGEKVEGKGTIYNMINQNCSGLVVDFTVDVYPEFECSCCCDAPTEEI